MSLRNSRAGDRSGNSAAEVESCARYEIADGTGDQDFRWLSGCSDTRADTDGDPGWFAVMHLAFADMYPHAGAPSLLQRRLVLLPTHLRDG